MRHIPNVLSAIRLILVGVFIFLFARAKYLACLIVFLTAFFTDLLDGYLARRNNWISDLGKVLDPLADKLMVIAALSWGVLPVMSEEFQSADVLFYHAERAAKETAKKCLHSGRFSAIMSRRCAKAATLRTHTQGDGVFRCSAARSEGG